MNTPDLYGRLGPGDEAPVPHTVDAQGYVLVDGQRVLNGQRKQVFARPTTEVVCQHCRDAVVTRRNALWRRWEESLGRHMYWISTALDEPVALYCARCSLQRMGALAL